MKYSLFGYGISNKSLAKYLVAKNHEVFVSDAKEIPLKDRIKGVIYEKGNTEKILKADIIVVSPGIPPFNPIITKAIQKDIPVVSDVELFYQIFKPKIIAITGTNGKSTTTALVNEIISKKYTSYIAGNFGVGIFDFAHKNYDFLVVELSSFQLHYTKTIKPYISVLLNLTPDHLDWHKGFENYKSDKYKIFGNQDNNDISIINFDLEFPKNSSKKITFHAKNNNANYFVKNNIIFEDSKKLFEVKSKLKGEHNLENILAAVAVGRACGICKENLTEAIYNFKPLEHRLEMVDQIDGIEFINDSKSTTTDSTLKAVKAYKKSVLILGGRRKGEDYETFIKTIKNDVNTIVLFGESSEDFEKYCQKYFISYIKADTMCDAVSKSFEYAKKSSATVLLSPATASYDMFENYKKRGETFKNCVKKLRNSKGF